VTLKRFLRFLASRDHALSLGAGARIAQMRALIALRSIRALTTAPIRLLSPGKPTWLRTRGQSGYYPDAKK
jgi:hypothetical protein